MKCILRPVCRGGGRGGGGGGSSGGFINPTFEFIYTQYLEPPSAYGPGSSVYTSCVLLYDPYKLSFSCPLAIMAKHEWTLIIVRSWRLSDDFLSEQKLNLHRSRFHFQN
jgi:hypothetical protein